MKVLMVCLGNICRSPVAEGILRHKAAEQNLPIVVDSAGTSDYHCGECPDQRSMKSAKSFGIDISDLKARQFSVDDFDRFDLILVMDTSNYSNVLKMARNEEDRAKVKMILDYSHPGKNMSVPDPYFGGEHGFTNVFNLLDRACDAIIEQYLKESRKEKQ